MTRPVPLLVDLAAGRPLSGSVDLQAVASAREHRMTGLLKLAVDAGLPCPQEAAATLASHDAEAWAINRILYDAAVDITAIAKELGIDIAIIKGPSIEGRWYGRIGERPFRDLDLVVAPWHLPRTSELVARLQPDYPGINQVPYMVAHDHLQSLDLVYRNLPIDLHLDVLKLELARAPDPETLWRGASWMEVSETARLPVLSKEVTLALAALHLNKDRFRFLLGYCDVLRIAHDPDLDWDEVNRLARAEGLTISLENTMAAVYEDLDLSPPRSFARSRAWSLAWPASIRLQGYAAEVRYRYRQFFLPLLDEAVRRQSILFWWRRIFPSAVMLQRLYPSETGPYFLRLIRGRIRRRIARVRHRRVHRALPD